MISNTTDSFHSSQKDAMRISTGLINAESILIREGELLNTYIKNDEKITHKLYESADKLVSHPPHYQSVSGLEVIDVIDAFTADLKGIEATDTGNIIKYACRWHQKNGVQDLEKILWYTNHLIKKLKEKETSK